MLCYFINQFLVESELPLPCAEYAAKTFPHTATPRVAIRCNSDASQEYSKLALVARRPWLRAFNVDGGLLICLPTGIEIHINCAGDVIRVAHCCNEERIKMAAMWICNQGLSICALLRGYLPLHAASVEWHEKYFAIAAPSGTGKTTMLWSFLDVGAKFGCDDVTHLTFEPQALAFPALALPAKLSREALMRRRMEIYGEDETLPSSDEFWIPIAKRKRVIEPRPLSAIFILRPNQSAEENSKEKITIHLARNGYATSLLMKNTQALWAIYPRLDSLALLTQYSRLAQTVPVCTVEYTRRFETLPFLLKAITNFLRPSSDS